MTRSNREEIYAEVLARRSLPPSSSPGTAESVLPPLLNVPDGVVLSQLDLAHELGEIILVLLRVGTLLACSGAAAFRVRDAMQRTAVSLGAERSEFLVSVDGITASVFDGGQFRTQVVRLPPVGVDMNLLCRIELLTRALLAESGQHSTKDVHARLDELQAAKRLYPRWLTVASLGAACAAFCGAGNGTWVQMACAFVGAALGHGLRLALLERRFPLVTIVVACAFVSSIGAQVCVSLLAHVFGVTANDPSNGIAILSSVLYLIPGVPLVTSLIDLVHFDISAGLSRAAYSALLVGCIAVGMFAFLAVAKVLPW